MDAVPFLVEEVGRPGVDRDQGRRWLHDLREYAMRRRGEAMLMRPDHCRRSPPTMR